MVFGLLWRLLCYRFGQALGVEVVASPKRGVLSQEVEGHRLGVSHRLVLLWVAAKPAFGLLPEEGGYLVNGPFIHFTPISIEIRLEPSVGPQKAHHSTGEQSFFSVEVFAQAYEPRAALHASV
jgi:hypothetical protein